jgi:uncharacterized membrane protein
MVALIVTIVLCTSLWDIIPSWAYPYLLVAIAFSLLFHVALISPYFIAYDIHLEYHFASLTASNAFWDRTIPNEYNGMLSITILPVIWSLILGVDLNWIFKIIYPLLYSLLPLVLYLAYKRQVGSRAAFLSAFLVISIDTFYFDMLGLARQIVASIFLVLLIFLISDRKIPPDKSNLLFLIFGAGLIVSHYSLAYLFLFLIVFTLCFGRFLKGSQPAGSLNSAGPVLICLTMMFAWYVFVSSVQFQIASNAVSFIISRTLESISGPGIAGLTPAYISPLHEIGTYLFYLLWLVILLGLLAVVLTSRRKAFTRSYLSFSIGAMLILMACLGVPSFAATLEVTRFYHFTSFLLAPFGLLGTFMVVDWFRRGMMSLRLLGNAPAAIVRQYSTRMTAIALVFVLLFQVGFIYEVAGDVPTSIPLSFEKKDTWPVYLQSAYIYEQDVVSAEWLSRSAPRILKVYGDHISVYGVLLSYGMMPTEKVEVLENHTAIVNEGQYVYLRSNNVRNGYLAGVYGHPLSALNTSQLRPLFNQMDAIYSNGQSQIYEPT